MIGFRVGENRKRYEKIKKIGGETVLEINTSDEDFFSKLKGVRFSSYKIKNFCVAIEQISEAKIQPFYVPVGAPAYVDKRIDIRYTEPKIIFDDDGGYIRGYRFSFNQWESLIKDLLPDRDGLRWSYGTEFEWYAFIVYLINDLVDYLGLSV